MNRSVVVSNSALVAGRGVVDVLGHRQLVLGAVVVRHHHDAADALAALVPHEVPANADDALELHLGPVGDELLPVLAPQGRPTGAVIELEVDGAVDVGEHDEAVAVGRAGRVGDVVLDALLARLHDRRRRRRVGGRDEVLLRASPSSAEVMCTHCSVRLRPTLTKKRSSGSSYTSTSSRAGVPIWWRHTWYGRMVASGRT